MNLAQKQDVEEADLHMTEASSYYMLHPHSVVEASLQEIFTPYRSNDQAVIVQDHPV